MMYLVLLNNDLAAWPKLIAAAYEAAELVGVVSSALGVVDVV